MESIKNNRFESLDLARGIAVVAMIVFHFAWDMRTYWPHPIFQFSQSLWLLGGGIIGGSFLFISGVATILTYRFRSRRRILVGSAQAIVSAIIISGVTFYSIPESPIYFGMLHCVGVTLLLAAALVGHPKLTLAAAALAFGLGFVTEYIQGNSLWFVWAGIVFPGYMSSDYFPLFPWSGVLFLGMYFAPKIYPVGAEPQSIAAPRALLFMGRHSLIIYLVHQPILLGIVKEIGMFA